MAMKKFDKGRTSMKLAVGSFKEKERIILDEIVRDTVNRFVKNLKKHNPGKNTSLTMSATISTVNSILGTMIGNSNVENIEQASILMHSALEQVKIGIEIFIHRKYGHLNDKDLSGKGYEFKYRHLK